MNSVNSVFLGISLALTVLLFVCYVVIDKESFIPIVAFFILITLSNGLLLKQKNETIM